ncbi:MAG: hypothetical protein LIP77_03535 [Planctomycetes bacterium]|nr:hypothetical protein [Planctomycetota bacterium]
MIQEIALSRLPAQRFQAVLDGQHCTIALRQKGARLFLDLETEAGQVCQGAVCLHGAEVTQSPTPNFLGGLFFVDTLGQSAPQWELLGDRYRLFFASDGQALPEDLNANA